MATEVGTIEREVHVQAPPEAVFRFLVDPERVVQWMGDRATVEPRPGGLFRLEYARGDVASGRFVEVDAPRRVVLTWGWEAEGDPVPPGASTVEVTLEPVDGGTRVRLRHMGLAPESIGGHEEGWDYFLQRLVEKAGGEA